jgi:ribosomal protein S18 acetylase RimI-like enzyme
VTVRDFSTQDADSCLSVFDSNIPKFFVPAEREEFREFLAALPGPYLVIEAEARIVACGGWAGSGCEEAALCWGMVEGSLHRQGIGRLLTEARLKGIRQSGTISRVLLNTSQHTTAFYERFGFVVVSVVPDGYAPGLDRCEMALDLGPDSAARRPSGLR